MKQKFFMMAAVLVLLSGCGLMSLHPIFTIEQLEADKRLLGRWHSGEGVVVFQSATVLADEEVPEALRPHKSRFYLCTRQDGKGKVGARYLAFLVPIGGHHFLDLYPLPRGREKDIDPWFASHELKLHTISRIDIADGQIEWKDFRDNYVEDLLKKHQVRIRHSFIEHPDDDVRKLLITATTAELQSFLAKYGSRKEAYNDQDTKNIYKKF